MDIVYHFQRIINAEYAGFKETIIRNFTKEGIFQKAYEINFYQSMKDYFNNFDSINDEKRVKELQKYNLDSISNVYEIYLKRENASITNKETIDEFLDLEIERRKGREEQVR